MEKIVEQKDSIIDTYATETGLQARNVEDLKKVIANDKAIDDAICDEKVAKAVEKADRRKKRWKGVAIGVGVMAVVEAGIIYLISVL